MESKQQILLDHLEHNLLGIKEYDLMTVLDKNTCFFNELGENTSLFKKHFFLFHHLYLLAEVLKAQSIVLEISALSIKLMELELEPKQKPNSGLSEYSGEIKELRNFYLDKDHLELPEEEIQDMLAIFWKRYLALDKKADAIKCLGLEEHNNLSRSQIKKRYNQLARQYHPDKGGDKIKFMQIKEAYEQLKKITL